MWRVAAAVVVLVAACGGGSLSLDEYADTIESLVAEMNLQVDAALRPLDDPEVTAGDVAEAFSRRAIARGVFLDALRDIDPPEEATEIHREALVIIEQLRDAEAAVSVKAGEPGIDLPGIFASSEALDLEAIDERAVAMCSMAEAAFDATSVREGFSGSSWMPAALKEAVDVAFRCTAEERGGP